jgi:hypothetical protein
VGSPRRHAVLISKPQARARQPRTPRATRALARLHIARDGCPRLSSSK